MFLVLMIILAASLSLVGFSMPETSRVVVGNGSTPAKGISRRWWSCLKNGRKKRRDVEGQEEEVVGKERKKPKWKPLNVLVSFRIMLYADAAAVLCMVASSYCVYYTFQVDGFPDNSSSAYAAGQIARCGLSAVSAAVLQPLIDAIGRGWYFTAFGLFIAISSLCAV